MGFLIRFMFWFSLVLLALPFDVGPDGQGRESVNPVQTLFPAHDAVGDLVGMCQRQPDVCETGVSAFHTIAERAGIVAGQALGMLESAPEKHSQTPKDTVTTGSIATDN